MPSVRKIEETFLESRYCNVTIKGEYVISKSEAIIANLLFEYKKLGDITYAYESKYTTIAGRGLKPDFVIDNLPTEKKLYW